MTATMQPRRLPAAVRPGWRADRGAVMVELALVLPVLLMLLVGIIEFGRAYNLQLTLQSAAREGAREAALGRELGEVETAVRDSARPHLLDAGAVDLSQATCPEVGDAQAVVEVTETFTFGIPFVDLADVDLTGRGAMRCGV
ncbi:MAG TPA: TadE/TadG family type IV pilus assembly protein [Jiangellaceae bacterium]